MNYDILSVALSIFIGSLLGPGSVLLLLILCLKFRKYIIANIMKSKGYIFYEEEDITDNELDPLGIGSKYRVYVKNDNETYIDIGLIKSILIKKEK